jgi:hypothetical protein
MRGALANMRLFSLLGHCSGAEVGLVPPDFSHLASGFHRCWPLWPGTRDLFALMQVRGTCDASSGGSGVGARNRVVAGSADAVPSDGCGLSDLLDPLYATGEQDREALDLAEGWARRWVTRWQAGKSA